jgi:hypothetical protein
MTQQLLTKKLVLPKPVYLKDPADLQKFEDTLKTLCEKSLSQDWDWTFKVGGKVHQKLQTTDASNSYFIQLKTDQAIKEEKEKVEKDEDGRPVISKQVAEAMGKRGWEIQKLKEEESRFFKINVGIFEEKELLCVRKEIWDWCVSCIEGENKKFFCAHLVRDMDKWDIQDLLKTVKEFLQTENYKEYGQRIERFFTSKPKQDEDIFSYMSRLDKYREEVERLEHLSEELGETVKIPKFFQVWKILSGLEQYPEYRIYTEKVQQMEPREYIKLQVNDIRGELHKLHTNKVQMENKQEKNDVVGFNTVVGVKSSHPTGGWETVGRDRRDRTPSVSHNTHHTTQKSRSLTPRKFPIQTTLQHLKVPDGECMGYFSHGVCPRMSKNKPCHFNHTPKQHQHQQQQQQQQTPQRNVTIHTQQNRTNSLKHQHNNNRTSSSTSPVTHSSYPQRPQSRGVSSGGVCQTCGNVHGGTCLWDKRCFNCGGVHSIKVCTKTPTIQRYGGDRRKSV